MGASYGVGSLVKYLVNPAKEISSEFLGKTLWSVLEGARSFTAPIVARAIVKEIGQELIIDPWVESTVSGLVRRMGGDAMTQMIFSSIAESGREALTGPLTNLINPSRSKQPSFLSTLGSRYSSESLKPTNQELLTAFNEHKAENRAQQEQRRKQLGLLGAATRVLSFISLAIGFTASQFLGPVGALAYSTLAAYCFSEDISLKGVFREVFKPVIKRISNSKVGDYYRNNKKKVLGLVGIGALSAGMMVLQALIPALSGFAAFGRLGLGFGGITIGMVDRSSSLDLNFKNSRNKLSRVVFLVHDNTKFCLRSDTSSYSRHNYVLVSDFKDYKEISCFKCGTLIGLYDLKESIFDKARQVDLGALDSTKGTLDISIYRLSWKKNKFGDYLDFPGLTYSGQTYQQVLKRAWQHYKHSSGSTTFFASTLKGYKIKKAEFFKLFNPTVLKIIRFQGDYAKIMEIEDIAERGLVLGAARKRTQDLADTAERFFIGLYKSQFKEFGRNILEGGRFVIPYQRKIINFDDLIGALDASKHLFSPSNAPVQNILSLLNDLKDSKGDKRYPFEIKRGVLISNLRYYFGEERVTAILEKFILKDIVNLYKRNLNLRQIARILNIRDSKFGTFSTLGISRILFKDFKDLAPTYNIKKVNPIQVFLKKNFIEELVSSGIDNIPLLLSEMWGYETADSLRHFLSDYMGGLPSLVSRLITSPSKITHLQKGVRIVKEMKRSGQRISMKAIVLELYDNYDELQHLSRTTISSHPSRTFKRFFGVDLNKLISFASTRKLFDFSFY